MDIHLKEGSHKSINELSWIDIPRFAVLTGPNGSGKTQLLELIAGSFGVFAPNELSRPAQPNMPLHARLEISEPLTSSGVAFLRSSWSSTTGHADLTVLYPLIELAWNDRQHTNPRTGTHRLWTRLWKYLEQKIGEPEHAIKREQFDESLPPNFMLLRDINEFNQDVRPNLSILVVSYIARISKLREQGFTSEQIEGLIGPLPWNTLNETFESAGLQYHLAEPQIPKSTWTSSLSISFSLRLINKSTGAIVSEADLSSGEKVIFNVALWSYLFAQTANDDHPKLLLLDEPDAHLHPALTPSFLRVVRSELVEKHGIRVIMTTHSPSTVALTDEASLFVMAPTQPRVSRVSSKWAAISRLTSGFTTIGSETKTVFVEAKDDVLFYANVQDCLLHPRSGAPLLDPARTINFIHSGVGNEGGGKQNVIKWVSDIKSTQVAGIVDRDEDKNGVDRVHVLRRRHLESYLFDPLYVFALIVDEGVGSGVLSQLSKPLRYSQNIFNLSQNALQSASDSVIDIYRNLLSLNHDESRRIELEYQNERRVFAPEWFIHENLKPLLTHFPKHLGVKWDRGHLIRRFRSIDLVPMDLVNILRAIQAS